MTEAEHTPGPWFAVFALCRDEGIVIPRVASQLTIKSQLEYASGDAHSFVCQTFSDGFHDEDQDIANAHLIAAAPDLLAALEMYALGPDWISANDCIEREIMARAAIAKAKGKS